ncbi:MAG: hypothetical protein GQ564_19155 [Bacteroidales bacterium]|nr:hypothetical protein [Bacteroidales bacterium]
MTKNNKYTVIIFVFLFTFFSCSKENLDITDITSDNIVNIEQAEDIINEMITSDNSLKKSSSEKFKIKRKKTFFDAENLPYLHIINLENSKNKAFVIVSGDKREIPVLAYSDKNTFNIDTIPYGVADWLQTEMECIDFIRSNNKKQNKFIKKQWENIKLPVNVSSSLNTKRIQPLPDPDPDDDPCGITTSFEVSPLLQTSWGQGCVYNEQCPSGCSSNCSRVPTGCVATAMAQVMNYHQHPSSYNWGTLLNIYWNFDFGSSGANEIARLMRDVGNSVDMDYDCDGSGAATKDVDDALEDDFNYSNGGDYDDFINKIETVKSNLRYNQPVIFAGCQEQYLGGLWYTGCHAWVCDGYRTFSNNCYGWLYFHMNWGWNGSSNGWFGISSWTPGTRDYKYNQRVVVNIHP